MALVKCKYCGYKGSVGFMPTSTCGMLLIPGFVVAVFISFHAFRILKNYHVVFSIVAAVVAAVAAFIICVLAIHYIPWTLEWLIAMAHKCPECGKRKWSYPFTEGFGL
jgi:hypothetical protein